MKIAIVLAGIGAGGAERVVSLLAGDRCARGDDVHVLSFVPPGHESYFDIHPAVTLHALDEPGSELGSGGTLRTIRRVWRLRQELKAIKPDVVVSFLMKISVITLIATRGLGIPVIISERNNPKAQPSHRFWRIAGVIAMGWASGIVMQTERVRTTLPETLRSRATVIANPCEIQPPDVETMPSPAPTRLVAVGRLVEQKGFDILIEAFSRIASAHPDWSLVIYGEGPERTRLERLVADHGLSSRVSLPGITERPGTWRSEGQVFVLSSRYEGFPNVLIEAMAAGMPVVSACCPYGPSEIIETGKTGLLVAPDDAGALAEGLDLVLSNADLREAFADSAPQAVRRYSLASVFAQWERLFDEVLSAKDDTQPNRLLRSG